MKKRLITALLISLTLLAGWDTLRAYVGLNLETWLFLLLLPILSRIQPSKGYPLRSGVLALGAFLLFYVLHLQLLFLLGLGFTVAFWVESRHGRLNRWPFILLLLLSPVLRQLMESFTFPLRLSLSEGAGLALQSMGFKVEVLGNVFSLGARHFSVDPACAGIQLIITGLMLCTYFLARAEREQGLRLSWLQIGVYYGLCFALVIAANFFRILALVLWQAPAGSFGHDFIGLIHLGLYMCLPIWLLLRWQTSRQTGQSAVASAQDREPRWGPVWRWTGGLLLLGLIGTLNTNRAHFRTLPHDPGLASYQIGTMASEILPNGIAKFREDRHLVYIKPACPFWRSDHTPTVCWQASGFVFSHIQLSQIAGEAIWTAQLVKEEEKLFTAWWYENGDNRTHSSWHWRWNNLWGGAPYRLINATAPDAITLRKLIALCLEKPNM